MVQGIFLILRGILKDNTLNHTRDPYMTQGISLT